MAFFYSLCIGGFVAFFSIYLILYRWLGGLPWQKVSCGQHQAATCAHCPKDHGSGKWMGELFCNGDCVWEEEACVLKKTDLPSFTGCPVCLTSVRSNYPVTLARCRPLAEEQMVEVGDYTLNKEQVALIPRDVGEWQARQDRARQRLLEETKAPVLKVIDEIAKDEFGLLDIISEVVCYHH